MDGVDRYHEGYQEGWTGKLRQEKRCPNYNRGYNSGACDRQQEEDPDCLHEDIDFYSENQN